jgi:purine-nucleoside phosphorylase
MVETSARSKTGDFRFHDYSDAMSQSTLNLELIKIDACVAAIQKRIPNFTPKLGIILGSGLGSFADQLKNAVAIDYKELPDFPISSVHGHAGRLVCGYHGNTPIVAMQGRVHFYEGYTAQQVAFPARVLCRMGIKHLTVTNAAGGINTGFKVGDLMAISDHLNLAGFHVLIGKNEDTLGPRFPDMSHAYDPKMLRLLIDAAKKENIELRQGVYVSLSGPSYETPAEIRMLRTLGGDAVGMSTVPEVIVASHMSIPVTGISCITNLAAGMSKEKLSHDEVSTTANQVKDTFTKLLNRFLGEVAAAL